MSQKSPFRLSNQTPQCLKSASQTLHNIGKQLSKLLQLLTVSLIMTTTWLAHHNQISVSFAISLHVNGHFPRGSRLASTRMSPFWTLLEYGGGDNWSCKSCKAPVTMSPPTNQHTALYRLDVVPVIQTTVSKH